MNPPVYCLDGDEQNEIMVDIPVALIGV